MRSAGRYRRFLWAAAAVLAAHAMVLSGLAPEERPVRPPTSAQRPTALSVRVAAVAAPAVVADVERSAVSDAVPATATVAPAVVPKARARVRPRPPAVALLTVAYAVPDAADPPMALLAAASPAAPSAGASATPPPEASLPVYATRPAASTVLHYTLRRGVLSASADLSYRASASGYEARLEGRLAGFTLLDWTSTGRFDAAGFAPDRFVDRRRGRSAQAANFQRGAGDAKITYSGAGAPQPLPHGAQDRLSWMLQLAAIAAARPQPLSTGDRISLYVSGARGDADVWSFDVIGRETLDTPLGRLPAVHLLREARSPRDTRAEIWLDLSHDHLPIRARLASGGDGDAMELDVDSVGESP